MIPIVLIIVLAHLRVVVLAAQLLLHASLCASMGRSLLPRYSLVLG